MMIARQLVAGCVGWLVLTGAIAAQEVPPAPESAPAAVAQADEPADELAREYFRAVKTAQLTEAGAALSKLKLSYPQDPLTELAEDHWLHHQLALAAENNRNERENMTVISYPVADLVVEEQPRGEWTERRPAAQSQLKDVALLITSTVSPHQWNDRHEGNAIDLHEGTLSLVIRATPRVHVEIGALLDQIRRLQALRISLNAKVMQLTAEEAAEFPLDTALTAEQLAALQQRLQGGWHMHVSAIPEKTIFNGRSASFDVPHGAADRWHVLLAAVASSDRRHVRLQMAASDEELTAPVAVEQARVWAVADGASLLVHLPGPQDHLAKKLGLLRELGVDTIPPQGRRTYLLVSPKILAAEEEEPLLGLGGTVE